MSVTRQISSRLSLAVLAFAAMSAVATAVIVLTPSLRFAYHSVPAHVAIETAATLIAALAAVLTGWRFLRGRQLADLALLCSFATLAIVDLCRALVPHLVLGASYEWKSWLSIAGSLIGLLLFVLAAFLVAPAVRRPRRALRLALGATLGLLVAVGTVTVLAIGVLPPVIDERLAPEFSTHPQLAVTPVVVVLQLTLASLLMFAAFGYVRQSRCDDLRIWLAVAAVFAAFSRVNYALFPSLYAELVYTGDIFRLAFYAAVLVGAMREIAGYQPRLAAAAVLEERRRVARDLHDGLTQELAYMRAQLATLRERGDERPEIGELERAASRALDESRLAISALARPADEPLDAAMAAVANGIAARGGARLTLDIQPDVEAGTALRETVLRILAEAVTNAVRHGRPSEIAVRLRAGGDLRLIVTDDGDGFEVPDGGTALGYGLTSMRDRAEAVGGRLGLRTALGRGTTVEAVLPLVR